MVNVKINKYLRLSDELFVFFFLKKFLVCIKIQIRIGKIINLYLLKKLLIEILKKSNLPAPISLGYLMYSR